MSLKKIEKGIRYTGNTVAGIGGFLMLVLLLLDTGDVIGRYVFNNPIKGTLEVSEVLMAGMVLFSWAYTQKMGGHVRVDLFISRYPSRARAMVNFATLLLSLAPFSVILWQSAIIAAHYTQQHRVLPLLSFPSGPFHFFVPVAAFFLCLELIVQIAHLIPEMRKGE